MSCTEWYCICRHTPNEITKNNDDWCGQWKSKDETKEDNDKKILEASGFIFI